MTVFKSMSTDEALGFSVINLLCESKRAMWVCGLARSELHKTVQNFWKLGVYIGGKYGVNV